jgi:hypothetical protein
MNTKRIFEGVLKIKKLIFVLLPFILTVSLFACNNLKEVQHYEQTEKKSIVSSEGYKQKVIIMDNVNDPLPPEARNIQYMPNKSTPQQIPNANLKDPIVITKMPYSEKNRPLYASKYF